MLPKFTPNKEVGESHHAHFLPATVLASRSPDKMTDCSAASGQKIIIEVTHICSQALSHRGSKRTEFWPIPNGWFQLFSI